LRYQYCVKEHLNKAMRELFPTTANLVAPPEQVAPGPDRPGWEQLAVGKRPETLNEILHKLYFETVNKRQPDGRINGGLDRNGNPVYYFVSPYADRFWENVEPGVEPLVRALKAKRYLTYSSCEGHCLTSRRYVGIAFADHESRERFCAPIEAATIPGVVINRLDTAANQIAEVTESGTVKLVKERPDPAKEAVGFNYAFGRDYEHYCFIELIICDKLPKAEPLWLLIRYPLSHGPALLRKFFRWNAITKRVVDLIQSDAVPKYRY
jgi:hypothetical protein